MFVCNVIKEVYDVETIHDVLEKFSNSLDSLSRGSEYREQMAKKFSLYGKFIIMLHNQEEIGFAAFYCNDVKSNTAYISMIAVDKKFVGRGYGVKLVNEVVEISKQNQMKKIRLEVNKNNNMAINFYLKVDFSIMEESEKTYYMERDIKENE